jgi:hypothetical protein
MADATQGKSADLHVLVDPLPSDVMLGRGRSFLRHPGNKRLKTVVEMNTQRYLNATNRNEKTCITQEIVRIIQTYGTVPGRFLRHDAKAGGWYQVDDHEARVKVSHAVRYRTKCNDSHAEVSESNDSLSSYTDSHAEVSESTDSLSSYSDEETDTVMWADELLSSEEAVLTVCAAHQPQRVHSCVSTNTTSDLLSDAVLLASLERDHAAILANLGSEILCLPPKEDIYDPDQEHGDFILIDCWLQ